MKLKWKEDGTIKSPLSRAKGLGASHHGTGHWLHQRFTALANIPLTIWLVWSVIDHISGAGYAEFTAWLAQPVNAVLMIFAILSFFYHAALGAQVIAEDYIGNEVFRFFKLLVIKFYFLAAAVVCIFSILKISFGG